MPTPHPFQFSLKSLLLFVCWLGIALGLSRLFPDTRGELIGTSLRLLPVQAILLAAILFALGGILGVGIGNQRIGLAIGTLVGLLVAVAWSVLRYCYLLDAAGSV